MLQLRPNCECCDRDLPSDSTDAVICSFEVGYPRHFAPRRPFNADVSLHERRDPYLNRPCRSSRTHLWIP